MIGGVIYNAIGAKKLVALAFLCHLLGLALTITAGGFWGLLISTFLIVSLMAPWKPAAIR